MTDEQEQAADSLERLVDQAVARLLEHADAVQVFVCRHLPAGKEDTRTLCYRKGDGNYHARYGMVKQWIIGEEDHVDDGEGDE